MNVLSLKCFYHNSVFSWIMSIRINYTNIFCKITLNNLLGIVLGNNLISLKNFNKSLSQTYCGSYIYYLLTLIYEVFAYLSVLTCYNQFLMVLFVDWGMEIVATVFRTLQTLEIQYSFLP